MSGCPLARPTYLSTPAAARLCGICFVGCMHGPPFGPTHLDFHVFWGACVLHSLFSLPDALLRPPGLMQAAQVLTAPLTSVISCLPVHCCACKGARAGAGREHGPVRIAAGPTLAVASRASFSQHHLAFENVWMWAQRPASAQPPTAVRLPMRLAHCSPHSRVSTHAKDARDLRSGRPVLPCRPPPCLHQRAASGALLSRLPLQSTS
jgi:hypothetical protein